MSGAPAAKYAPADRDKGSSTQSMQKAAGMTPDMMIVPNSSNDDSQKRPLASDTIA